MNTDYSVTFNGVEFDVSGQSETPESMRRRAKDLRKQAKRTEKRIKAEKRIARQRAAQRQVAIDALVRVASDPKKGYAAVLAATELLRVDEAC